MEQLLELISRNQLEEALDYIEKENLFDSIKENKNPKIQLIIALMYNKGIYVEQSYSKSVQILEQCAKEKESLAYNPLGMHYLFGQGVKQDIDLAKIYFEKAHEDQQLLGTLNLIKLIASYQLPKEEKTFLELIDELKEKQFSPIYEFLSQYYASQGNRELTIQYLKEGSKLDDINCIYQLAIIYQEGHIIEKNLDKALERYTHLRILHQTQFIKNEVEILVQLNQTSTAYKLLRDEIEKGNKDATKLLINALINGQPFGKSYREARKYLALLEKDEEINELYKKTSRKVTIQIALLVLSIILLLVVVIGGKI